MSLASGTRIGPYEIIALRGAGGMGEVYRARDTRLDRSVALKLLPPGLAASEDLRARFEREARAISALSHPNICALFDIGSEDGTEYLVMEYLDGETLAERLARGPLPTSLVVRYGAQIAEGLHHAHRAGITHRDLKPGNIMITDAGAKILDFGLAKFIEPAPRVFSDDSAPATHRNPITTEGTIVGTMHYMSPEQIEGKTLDQRTDIFSLGVILYEMSTGQRPFRGESPASLIASIISNDPIPIRALRPDVIPALDRIVQTAIEKNPNERWQTAHDVGRQLRWISDSSQVAEGPLTRDRRRISLLLGVALTAIASAALTWAVLRFTPGREPQQGPISVHIVPAPGLELVRFPEAEAFAVRPDGGSVAFIASRGETRSLYIRDLSSFDVRQVEDTEGASGLFWSSDGEWIGYSARGKLWKHRVSGGATIEAICDITPFGARASWRGNDILFADSRGERKEIYRVSDAGGIPQRVTTLREDEFRHSWPLLLPDGKSFIYQAFESRTMNRSVRLARLDASDETILTSNVSFTRLAGDEHLVYVRDGTLLMQRIDIERRALLGEPTTIATDVSYFYPTSRADFDASSSGAIVFRTETSHGRLVMLDRKGTVTRTVDAEGLFWDHALSPDDKHAAVTVVSRDTGLMDIWIYDLERGIRDRFTSEPAIETSPSWTLDGRTIIYSQGEGGTFPHLVRRSLTESTSEDLTPRGTFQYGVDFSPDGNQLYFASAAGIDYDIQRLSTASKAIEPVVSTRFNESSPAVSPDGRWLAYVSNATGGLEVHLIGIGTGDPSRIRISTSGGREPRWRGDGKELFFINSRDVVTAATPGALDRWESAKLEELFRLETRPQGFDVSRDGQTFLVSDITPGPTDSVLHVIIPR